MTPKQKIELRQSEIKQRLGVISGLTGDDYSDEVKAEEVKLHEELTGSEVRLRSAILSEGAEAEKREKEFESEPDAEMRERIELRSKASLSAFFLAAARGRAVTGAEAELQSAAGVGGIPIELWDTPRPSEQRNAELRTVTGAPGTVGVNLDMIRPAVFANAVLPRLGVEMPRVQSGTYASATINASLTAAAKGKGVDQEATAATFTVTTATPKRVSARLELTLEDIAAVGQANFESALRENLSLAISDELDDQGLNGNGTAPNLTGFLQRLTNPSAPAANVESFDRFVAKFADGVDGLWAQTMMDVGILAGVDTYRLAEKVFQSATNYKGELSAASYLRQNAGGLWTSKRMPDTDSHIQQAILYRKGRSMMGGSAGMRTAILPHWGEIGIDDIYSGSKSGTRAFTMHVLLGDVIIVQPDAYAQVAFRVSS